MCLEKATSKLKNYASFIHTVGFGSLNYAVCYRLTTLTQKKNYHRIRIQIIVMNSIVNYWAQIL